MNLLDHFILQHCQVSLVHGELLRVAREGAMHDAKVEMSLAPRLLETGASERLPSYQVTARLVCVGGGGDERGPAFQAKVGMETVYQQTSGAAIDLHAFTANHASLTRQIYPLLAHELRLVLTRMGLSDIKLPFDLKPGSKTVSVTRGELPSVH